MMENKGAEAMEVGPGRGRGRLNLGRQIMEETGGGDEIGLSQSEVAGGDTVQKFRLRWRKGMRLVPGRPIVGQTDG